MARAKAAQRAAAQDANASLTALLSPARAAASRKNGARSCGPKTPEGKARSAQNALKHGLRAQHFVVLGDEDLDAFAALEDALMAVLAPQDPLQGVLARRIVAASWRLERSDRIEAEMLAQNMADTASFGLGLIRDCHRGRAFDTLLRYRGGTLAELWRSLHTLKALQAEAKAQAAAEAAAQQEAAHAQGAQPNEPKARQKPGEPHADAALSAAPPVPDPAAPVVGPAPARGAAGEHAPGCREPASSVAPIEPKLPTNPGESAAAPAADVGLSANRCAPETPGPSTLAAVRSRPHLGREHRIDKQSAR